MSATADAPALEVDQLTGPQRAGKACCWCRAWPDRTRPVSLPRGADLQLLACPLCADLYRYRQSRRACEPQPARRPAEVGDLVRDETAAVDAVVTDIRHGRPMLRLVHCLSDGWEPADLEKITVIKRRGAWTQ